MQQENEDSDKGRWSEDWLAVLLGLLMLGGSLVSIERIEQGSPVDDSGDTVVTMEHRLKGLVAKPASWIDSPLEAFQAKDGSTLWGGVLTTFILTAVCFGFGCFLEGTSPLKFAVALVGVFLLALFAYLLAGHQVIKAWNLSYALWALLVGLLVSNTVGTPEQMLPAVRTELFIKTGLVLLGSELLLGNLIALGLPGVFVAWVVTPIVLVSTYWFGQRVLKIESRSLNMVISADMSVCGVSAAIASAAACRAKREELSVAIGISLAFTVVMMVVMPILIRALGMGNVLGGAWMGGTIDATGAVAAAGAFLGDDALQVATTIKMIQNILIGVIAFAISVYWVTCVERGSDGERSGVSEVWVRFPKFIIGFVFACVLFSVIHDYGEQGALTTKASIGFTKGLRGWFFCLAFVSIGLESNFRVLAKQLSGGKPLLLYLVGQSLNLCLTLLMAWLMFEVVFPETVSGVLQ